MTGAGRCSRCGGALDRDGLCPECLIGLALGGADAAGGAEEPPPSTIGPYRVLERLGEGGMGTVYLAEQQEPMRRRVALKVIKPGMDSREVIARFRTERQALALMDHPGIARVFDAGTTEEGRPYFVMEYVQGAPITVYCDERRLGTRQRVELFVGVCRAVEHAHRRGMIHRDLKPSNVLVTEVDGAPAAKIIDFGVAKATQRDPAEGSVLTELGRILGTAEYMSPEQARGEVLDVDTRTDVYSLGVLLYELLVGVLPFEPAELRRAGIEALLRAVREHESPRPSRRISTLGRASIQAAERRRTDPVSLARQLRSDLDWIVMRAIEKDRERRYSGASELSADLERYLRDEPVLAGPPGGTYRLRKFLVKHRFWVGTTALVLLAAGSVAGFYTVRLRAQRDRAESEAVKARQVVEFIKGLFEGADPRETAGEEMSLGELLSRGAARLDGELSGQPAVQAEIANLLGNIYTELGRHDEARDFLERSLEDYAAATDEPGVREAAVLRDLARLDYKEGHHDEAERHLRRTLQVLARVEPDAGRETALTRRDLGLLLAAAGKLAGGVAECERALAILDKVPEADPERLESQANCGYLILRSGDRQRARTLLEPALERAREVLGPRHPDLGYYLDYCAELRRGLGDIEGAEAAAREALEIRRSVLGQEHPQTAESVHNVGVLLGVRGDLEGAAEMQGRALALRRKIFGNEHRQVAISLYSLAVVQERLLHTDEAQAMYEEAAAIQRKVLGPQHYAYARTLGRLGALRVKAGDSEAAEPVLREALEVMRVALPPGHPESAAPLLWLGWALALRGRGAEAEPFLREAVEVRRGALPAGAPQIAEVEFALAACLLRLGREDEARPLLDSSAPALLAALPAESWLARQVTTTRARWPAADD